MPTTYAIPNGRTVMDATTYTGNGSTLAVTNQYGFKPDFVWYKSRVSGVYNHGLFDSVRGATNFLASNSTAAEQASISGVSAFNTNGFTVGSDAGGNSNGASMVGWQWQAGQGTTSSNTAGNITSTVSVNATAGFSVVTFAGSNVNGGSIGHGLGVTPAFFIIKARNSAQSWGVYHQSLTSPNDSYLLLNTTDARASFSGIWTPSSTTITFPTLTTVTNGPFNYVVYCWAPVAGFSAFGSYTGNGSTDGPFVYTGFKPKFLMYKRTDSAGGWFMVDSTRNPYNTANYWLNAAATDAEQTDDAIDLNSNGFKIRTTGTGTNASGGSYVYMVWAENPFKYANAR